MQHTVDVVEDLVLSDGLVLVVRAECSPRRVRDVVHAFALRREPKQRSLRVLWLIAESWQRRLSIRWHLVPYRGKHWPNATQ